MRGKRLLLAVLSLAVLLLALSGCGGGEQPSEQEDTETAESTDGDNGDVGSDDSDDSGDTGADDADDADTDDGGDADDADADADTDSEEAEAEEPEFVFNEGLDENGFFSGITATDYVTLQPYIGVEVSPSVTTASEEELNGYINYVLAAYVDYTQVTDRPVQYGDAVDIDYTGYMDGEAFEGGSTNGGGVEVFIGVSSFIDGFLEQIVGHMPGETFDINVTFPDPYQNNPDYAGKDAVFTITVNYIESFELTDENAVTSGFESAEDMRKQMEEEVVSSKKNEFFSYLIDQQEVSQVPQQVIDCIVSINLNYNAVMAYYYYGMTLDDYLYQGYGFESEEEFVDYYADSTLSDARISLVVQAIAETEGLRVTTDDIAAAEAESSVEFYGEEFVKFNLLSNVVMDFIFDNAVYT